MMKNIYGNIRQIEYSNFIQITSIEYFYSANINYLM